MVVPMEDINTGGKTTKSEIIGMYLLNEGNMGSNKATLDYLDLSGKDSTVHYYRNIYSERNPSTVMSLGDVGNDCQIYGSRLWLVINCSNKVEVARAADAVRIGKVNIPNCRYVTFKDGFAYVSSYVGTVYGVGSQEPVEVPWAACLRWTPLRCRRQTPSAWVISLRRWPSWVTVSTWPTAVVIRV